MQETRSRGCGLSTGEVCDCDVAVVVWVSLQCIVKNLELFTEPKRRIVYHLMDLALADVQGNNLAILGIAIDEGDVVEQAKVLLRVLQTFSEIEADNIVGYVVAARLYAVDDAAHALFLGVKTEIDEGDFEPCNAEVVYHPQHHFGREIGLEGEVFLLLQCFVLLFLQFGGYGATHPAVGPVGVLATKVEHEFVAVERGGADVEGAEAALTRAIRTGYDGELWTTLHYFAMR